jgi:hypothetical protein
MAWDYDTWTWRSILAMTAFTIAFSFAASHIAVALRDDKRPAELTCADWPEDPVEQVDVVAAMAGELDDAGAGGVIRSQIARTCRRSRDPSRPIVDGDFRGSVEQRLSRER